MFTLKRKILPPGREGGYTMVVPEVISLERERYATLMQKLTNPLAMLASDHEYVKGVFTKCLNTDSLAHEVRLTIALPVN